MSVGDSANYIEYGSKLSLVYKDSIQKIVSELKDFCVEMATAYAIINMSDRRNDAYVPRIKSVVYCGKSDVFYIYVNNIAFSDYLAERVKRFFYLKENEYLMIESFKGITKDIIDEDNIALEVNFNDVFSISNNTFFNLKTIKI